MTTSVDLRCPVVPRRLFGRWQCGDATIVEGNLIEFACDECRKARRRMGEPDSLVLHRFNVLGRCVESEVIPRDQVL